MEIHHKYVAVVILNYNGKKNEYLPRFLPSVNLIDYPNYGVYVIDNGSTDDSCAYLRSQGFNEDPNKFKDSKHNLISLDKNHWFAKGYNLGLDQIDAPYYLLLNSDVEVTPGFLTPMVQLLDSDATIAACQPKIRMFDEKDLFEHAGAAGGWIDYLGYPFCRGRIFSQVEKDMGQYDDDTFIFWASGAALFIRSNLFKEVGGFDPDFKAHMEEIDLCWRLKRIGYQIGYCPDSVVWHVGGGTLPKQSPMKTYLNFRNSLITLYQNTEGRIIYSYIFIRLILDGVAAVRFLFSGEFANIVSIFKAHWYFFIHFFSLRTKRSKLREKINLLRIGPSTDHIAKYDRSIVWAHFFKGKTTFKALVSAKKEE